MKESIILTAFIMSLISGCGSGATRPTEKDFEVILCPVESSHSAIEDMRREVINDPYRFTELFLSSDLDSQTKPPLINFDETTVVAIHLGAKSSSGHQVRVTTVEEVGSRVEVSYETIYPAGECEVDDVITYPYCFISVAKDAKEIIFKENRISQCSKH